MKPDQVIFNIGETIYKQPIRLTRFNSRDKGCYWEIYKGQANQQDDASYISGLTKEVILKLAEAVSEFDK